VVNREPSVLSGCPHNPGVINWIQSIPGTPANVYTWTPVAAPQYYPEDDYLKSLSIYIAAQLLPLFITGQSL